MAFRTCGLLLLAALLVGTSGACRTRPLTVPATVVLAPDKGVDVASLRITFAAVTSDSRCPINAICVWAGEAIVHLRVKDSATTFYDLHTSGPLSSVQHGDLRIALTDLQPFPVANQQIQPNQYRATIEITEN